MSPCWADTIVLAAKARITSTKRNGVFLIFIVGCNCHLATKIIKVFGILFKRSKKSPSPEFFTHRGGTVSLLDPFKIPYTKQLVTPRLVRIAVIIAAIVCRMNFQVSFLIAINHSSFRFLVLLGILVLLVPSL